MTGGNLGNSPKLEQAMRHIRILTWILLGALFAGILAIWLGVGVLDSELGLKAPVTWIVAFTVALVGSSLNRMVAVSFEGFKYKRYDALAFPHRLVIAFRAPFVAVALILLGGTTLTADDGFSAWRLAGAAFGLGYFGDLAFERFRDLVYTLLGKDAGSGKIGRPLVKGIDVPLRSIELDAEDLPEEMQPLADRAATLRGAGIEYGHELIELWETAEGRSRLKEQVDLSEEQLRELVDLVDVARTGASPRLAWRLVQRGVRSGRAVAASSEDEVRSAIEGTDGDVAATVKMLQRNAERLL